MDRNGKVTSVLICGVGGQGVLVASEILARAALASGLDVKKSEVHGMAQRGGSVVSQVRFGPKVHSPLIPDGEVDLLVGFEELETLRWLHLLGQAGTVVVNRHRIFPPTVALGKEEYPDTDAILHRQGKRVVSLDAVSLAAQAGSPKVANTVIVGALSGLLDFPLRAWRKILAQSVPPKTLEANLKAFDLGRSTAR